MADLVKLARAALDTARDRGAAYADLRFQFTEDLWVQTRENMVKAVQRTRRTGANVRVIYRGAWGFAATQDLTEEGLRKAASDAFEIAQAVASLRQNPVMPPGLPEIQDSWHSPYEKDPFEVPVREIAEALLALNAEALKVQGVRYITSWVHFVKERKAFANTYGSFIDQTVIRTDMAYTATAVDLAKGDFATRNSYIPPRQAGYEHFERHVRDLDAARKVAEEAVEKLSARPLPEKPRDLVIHPSQLWLTIHESVGHATELDRILGYEANFAGTSFIRPSDIGKLRYGADLVNFTGDRATPGWLATWKYDDDGFRTQTFPIVRNGVLVDVSSNFEFAARLGLSPRACSYADSYARFPIIRIPNLYMEPGPDPLTLEDLIGMVDEGLYFHGDASWSIDQQRKNFQFGGDAIWEIKNGRLTRMVRDVVYQSNTTEFWGAVAAIGGKETFEMYGTFFCGKGEPEQVAPMSHGAPVVLVKGIRTLPVEV